MPVTIANIDDWEFSVTLGAIGTLQSLAVNLKGSFIWAGHQETNHNWFLHSTNVLNQQSQVGDVATFIKQGSTLTMKLNGTVIGSTSFTATDNYWVGFYTNNGRVQHLKNIILKSL